MANQRTACHKCFSLHGGFEDSTLGDLGKIASSSNDDLIILADFRRTAGDTIERDDGSSDRPIDLRRVQSWIRDAIARILSGLQPIDDDIDSPSLAKNTPCCLTPTSLSSSCWLLEERRRGSVARRVFVREASGGGRNIVYVLHGSSRSMSAFGSTRDTNKDRERERDKR